MKRMIPKIIHYCWFGHNKKSRLIQKCVASWRYYMPDFKIIEWNEENFDVNQNEYIKQAYEKKKWAYVSDYARMKVLYDFGGIYFDTDVEVIKNFPEELLELEAFAGIEEFSKMVAPGLVYACHPHDSLVRQMLISYEQDVFELKKIEEMITINKRITAILDKKGFIHEDCYQSVEGLTIYPSKVFCGYNGKKRKIEIQQETITVHHYEASWLPWYRKVRLFIGTVLRRIYYYKK